MDKKPTPQSRTGKFVQGLFGGRGKQEPPPNYTRSVESIEPDDLGFANNDDEETNWDDEETPDVILERLATELPIVDPPPVTSIIGDPEDWDDDALPAATVKKEVVISTKPNRKPDRVAKVAEDFWESIPAESYDPIGPNPEDKSSLVDRSVGLWTTLTLQLQSLLPQSLKKLAAIILTGAIVLLVTLSISILDGLLANRDKIAQIPSPPAISAPVNSALTPPQASPEQLLADSLSARLDAITSEYPDDIINNLFVDLSRDRLVVKLNLAWYLIDDLRQNELTAKMWQQATANHFSKLEVQDLQGKLVARSPVVGNEMVILNRRQNS
jgi:hypothetical protein